MGPKRRIASRRSATKPGSRSSRPVPIGTAEDVAAVATFADVADRILLDAKPPKGADRPGGLGVAFDWALLKALDPALPFMLSGGLTPETVAAAIKSVRPLGVDVSSGVETAPGVKDAKLIAAFITNARAGRGELSHECHRERRGPGQFPAQRPGRRGPFRHLWRALRRRNADAADPRSRGGLSRRAGRSRPIRPSSQDLATHYVGRPVAALSRQAPDRASRRRARSGSSARTSTTPARTRSTTASARSCWRKRMGKTRVIAETGAGPARRRRGDGVRKVRLPVRRLHGRDRRRAAGAERAAHEDAGRRGAAGDGGRRHAQGRDERGAARLGDQRRYHLLPDRHRGGSASLSGDGAQLPVGDRRRDQGAVPGARGPAARRGGRLHRRRLQRHRHLPSVPRRSLGQDLRRRGRRAWHRCARTAMPRR